MDTISTPVLERTGDLRKPSALERRLAAAKARLVASGISPAERRRAGNEFARLARLRLEGPEGRRRHAQIVRAACDLPATKQTCGDRARLAALGRVCDASA